MWNSSYRLVGVFSVLVLIVEHMGGGSTSVYAQGEGERSQFCSIDLASFLPPPYGNVSYSGCQNVWETFVLRLQFSGPLAQQPTLLAFGSRIPVNHKLSMHDDKTTIRIDYTAGPAVSESGGGNFKKMKRSHGILGILAWGLILPTGAIVARFLKQKEPLWYYLHTIIQFTGFIIALAGIVVGQALYNHIHAEVAAHRGIGYFALTLSILQVLAFFIRPDKETKLRRLWSAYHRWFGVITLFFGALNIALGIQVGGAGPEWRIGYGFLVGTLIITAVVLQVLSMMRKPEKTIQTSTTFQMS